jgi:hypothetical protein
VESLDDVEIITSGLSGSLHFNPRSFSQWSTRPLCALFWTAVAVRLCQNFVVTTIVQHYETLMYRVRFTSLPFVLPLV